jgi:flagellar biogenesis protein FliO
MLQQILAVFLVLGLLLAVLWLLRRQGLATYNAVASSQAKSFFGLGRHHSDRRLRVIERLALTPQHALHLISIEDQFVILVTSPAGCQPVPIALTANQKPDAHLKSRAAC